MVEGHPQSDGIFEYTYCTPSLLSWPHWTATSTSSQKGVGGSESSRSSSSCEWKRGSLLPRSSGWCRFESHFWFIGSQRYTWGLGVNWEGTGKGGRVKGSSVSRRGKEMEFVWGMGLWDEGGGWMMTLTFFLDMPHVYALHIGARAT